MTFELLLNKQYSSTCQIPKIRKWAAAMVKLGLISLLLQITFKNVRNHCVEVFPNQLNDWARHTDWQVRDKETCGFYLRLADKEQIFISSFNPKSMYDSKRVSQILILLDLSHTNNIPLWVFTGNEGITNVWLDISRFHYYLL